MATNIATLAVKFVADTSGLKQGAAQAGKIVSDSAKPFELLRRKRDVDLFAPDLVKEFKSLPKIIGESPFGKPQFAQNIGSAFSSAVAGTGSLQSALVALGPVGLAAGAAITVGMVQVTTAIKAAYLTMEAFNASANRIASNNKLATRLDLTYKSLQKLQFVAGDDVPIETLTKAMEHMGRTIGSGGMSLEKRFSEQAKRIASIRDPAMRSAEAVRVFGKEAGSLIPVLTSLASNATRFDRFSGKFGFLIEDKDANNIERMNNAWSDAIFIGQQLIDKFVSKFGGPMAATLETLIDLTEGWADALSEIGVTWDDVGGFAVGTMKTIATAAAFVNSQLQIQLGYLQMLSGKGDSLLQKGLKNSQDLLTGKFGRKFDDKIVNGTDFSQRGGSFGGAFDGPSLAPSVDRFSQSAARIINAAAGGATMSAQEKAAVETAKNTEATKKAVEKVAAVFDSGNLPVLAVGSI